ncbi:MAG: hypothetical protein HY814_03840 [Candidatus Riflebacteria bacterium]|nr:hypothetical protein [Candidatus Riflebacteria bacterium]
MEDQKETTALLDGRMARWLSRYEETLARGDLDDGKAAQLLDKMQQIARHVIIGEITIDTDGYIYRSATVFGETMVIGIPPEVDRGTAEMVKDLAQIIELDAKEEGPKDG